MKNLLILFLTLISFTTFSQIKITNTGHSVVFIDVIQKNEILRMDICGEYESVNILKNEKPKELKLVFNNNTYINLELLDDNFTNDDYRFYWTGNYKLSKGNLNFLETFLLKEWILVFKNYQVKEIIKPKNSLKFYNHINKKCINEETK
jgi:hypothetical protein